MASGHDRENLARQLAHQLADIYAAAEDDLAAQLAKQLKQGIDSPQWVRDKRAALGVLRRQAQQVIARLERDEHGRIQGLVTRAWQRGGQAALDELAALSPSVLSKITGRGRRVAQADLDAATRALPGGRAIAALVHELTSTLTSTHAQILRWDLDVYRDVVATVAGHALAGIQTRAQIAQAALDRLLAGGVHGFTDKSGRRWDLASYVEMATRTTLAHAQVQAALDAYQAEGFDLVIVSNAPQECVLCRPWEGKVLSITGHSSGHASVAQATAAGLLHPNCRHSLSLYIPGVTRPHGDTADPKGDEARQRQREIERHIRDWKLRQAGALDDAAGKRAAAKVTAWQAELRTFLAQHPELRRLSRREQVGHAR